MQAEHSGLEVTVAPNVKIKGCITGIGRQIDVLVDARWCDDGVETRMIVDAKHCRTKLDVEDVESFGG